MESCADKRSDYEVAVSAHAQHFDALLEREGPRLAGGGSPDEGRAQLAALKRLAHERGNFVEAFEHSLHQSQPGRGQGLVGYLWRYLDTLSAPQLIVECYDKLWGAEGGHAASGVQLQAGLALSTAAFRTGQFQLAREYATQTQVLASTTLNCKAEMLATRLVAQTFQVQGELALAATAFAEALSLAHRHGIEPDPAALNGLGVTKLALGDPGAAGAFYAQALTAYRRSGDRLGEAAVLGNLGIAHREQGRFASAEEFLLQTLAIYRELAHLKGISGALSNLGNIQASQGHFEVARGSMTEALALQREIGDQGGVAISLGNLGTLEAEAGNLLEARQYHKQVLPLYRAMGHRTGEGHALLSLAILEYQLDDFDTARQYVAEALTIRLDTGHQPGILACIAIAGAVLSALQQWGPAALALFGSAQLYARLNLAIESDEQPIIDSGNARLQTAVAGGEVRPDDLLLWKQAVEALSLDELAELTIRALGASKGHYVSA